MQCKDSNNFSKNKRISKEKKLNKNNQRDWLDYFRRHQEKTDKTNLNKQIKKRCSLTLPHQRKVLRLKIMKTYKKIEIIDYWMKNLKHWITMN